MHLSEELFIEIRAALGCDDDLAGRQDERRDDPRLSVDVDVTIEPYGVARGVPRSARLKNFSKAGLNFLDSRAARAGEQYIVHLPRRIGTIPLVYTVKNSRVRMDGGFCIGARFTSGVEKNLNWRPVLRGVNGIAARESDMALLRDRLDSPDSPPLAGNKRRSARAQRCLPVRIMHFGAGRAGPVMPAELRDVSRGGVCIIHAEPLKPGEKFLLQVVDDPGPHWMLHVVASCRAMEDGRYRIGASYQRMMRGTGRGLRARVRNWLRRGATTADSSVTRQSLWGN